MNRCFRVGGSQTDETSSILVCQSSGALSLEFGVQFLEFCAGVFDSEVPVDAALFGVGFVRPHFDFWLQSFQFSDAATSQTLASQATEFAFCHVQPAATFSQLPCLGV